MPEDLSRKEEQSGTRKIMMWGGAAAAAVPVRLPRLKAPCWVTQPRKFPSLARYCPTASTREPIDRIQLI